MFCDSGAPGKRQVRGVTGEDEVFWARGRGAGRGLTGPGVAGRGGDIGGRDREYGQLLAAANPKDALQTSEILAGSWEN